MKLVGFIARIYHDARSPERQIYHSFVRSYFLVLVFTHSLDPLSHGAIRHAESNSALFHGDYPRVN